MRGRLPIVFLGAFVASCVAASSGPSPNVEWFRRGLYAGGSVGYAETEDSSSDMRDDLEDRGYTLESVDLDDDDVAYEFYLGYRFDVPVGLELAYVNLGESDADLVANPSDVDGFLGDVANVQPLLGEGIQLRGRWFFFEYERVQVSASAGFWVWEADVTAKAANGERQHDDQSGIDPTVGIAATLGLTDRLDLRASWDRYYFDGDYADAFWFGLQVGLL